MAFFTLEITQVTVIKYKDGNDPFLRKLFEIPVKFEILMKWHPFSSGRIHGKGAKKLTITLITTMLRVNQ